MIKKNIVLFLIIILALVLRVWDLPNVPAGLTWDEAALGYNAYSIMLTGRDEYGQLLPLALKSFGDYKPAFYTYLTIPFVFSIGLSELAVRLPSALAGVGSVVLVYFLAMELFKKRGLALLSSLMLAISPLAIQFSRVAFESNAAVFLNLAGVLFFIKGSRKSWMIFLSVVFFGLSIFTYQASRLFVPLLIGCLFLIYRRKVSYGKWFSLGSIVLVAIVLVQLFLIFGLGQGSRLQTANFFAYQRSEEQIGQIAKENGMDSRNIWFQILHGEWFAYIRGLAERYLIYFSPKMLFIDGDPSPRHRVPDIGALYYFSVLLIPLGLLYLIRIKADLRLLLFWLFVSVLPAVFARDLINLLRASNMTVPLVIFEGAGLYFIMITLKNWDKKISYPLAIIIFSALLLNVLIYFDKYFIHAPKEYSRGFLYGYKQIFNQVNTKTDFSKYDHVVVSDKYGQPYIYYLFYTKYPPDKFQKQAVLDQPSVDVGTVRKIDNIEFRPIYWPSDRGLKNSLFIGTIEELPDQDVLPFKEFEVLGEVNFLDGMKAFRAVEVNK